MGTAELKSAHGLREADAVHVQVIVDNVADPVSTSPDFVTSEWDALRRAGMTILAGSCQCCASHGLSLLVRAEFGSESASVLFDAGPADATFEYNVERLGCDMGEVGGVVLSHGHWDHAGGLLKAISLIRAGSASSDDVPCTMHPGVFVQRGAPRPLGGILPFKRVASVEELEQAGARTILTSDAQVLLDGAFYVSGEIPRRTSFEQGLRGHLRMADDGESWVPDPLIMDEKYLAVAIRGRGLLLLSACSHAGIVNVVLDARSRFPGVRVFGVMGGLHLSGGNEVVIDQTVDALAPFELDLIAPGHCTGWRAVGALSARFGDRVVVPLAVGQVFSLAANETSKQAAR